MIKAFWGGVVAIVVAIIIFIAQGYYNDLKSSEKQSITVDHNDNVVTLGLSTLSAIIAIKPHDRPASLKFAEYTVKNSGTEPLINQSVTLRAESNSLWKGILLFGTYRYPANSDADVSTKMSPVSLTINYRILNPGETHSFWTFYDSPSAPDIIAHGAGLNLVTKEAEPVVFGHDDETFWAFFVRYMLWPMLGFIAGIFLAVWSITSDLKKRGFDYVALTNAKPVQGVPDA